MIKAEKNPESLVVSRLSGYIFIPTRSLNRNLNQFELGFIACGISIISIVCQIWSI